MVKTELLQKTIINALKADAALIAVLGTTGQVKESQWQGTIFTYPAVRVDIDPQTPIGNGIDHLKLSDCYWRVRVYSEQDSSHQCNQLAGLTFDALFNKQFTGTDTAGADYLRLIRVDIIDIGRTLRIAERLWMAESTFYSQVNLINPP